ncbi:MAG: hypothetical protein C5B55_10645 [Blastocatellia bacterium]|nr:MAG: hypothetical protein C5B55_10645 [Blastocatellia bacterium]
MLSSKIVCGVAKLHKLIAIVLFLPLLVLSRPTDQGTLIVKAYQEPAKAPVEIQFRELRLGRPPLVYLTVELVLRNSASEPKWFLIPSNLGNGRAAIGQKGGIDSLEVFAPNGQGRVAIGRFLGTGGFHAVQLPAQAEIRLRRFPISYWGDPPKSLDVEVVIAKSLMLGDESAESWFGSSALTDVKADISNDAEDPKRIEKSRHTRDNKEITPTIDVDHRLRLTLAVDTQRL